MPTKSQWHWGNEGTWLWKASGTVQMGSDLSWTVSYFIPRTFKLLSLGVRTFSPESEREQHGFDTSAGREKYPCGALNAISHPLWYIFVLHPLLFCSSWPSPHLSLLWPKTLCMPWHSSLSQPGEGKKSIFSSHSEARGAQVSTGCTCGPWSVPSRMDATTDISRIINFMDRFHKNNGFDGFYSLLLPLTTSAVRNSSHFCPFWTFGVCSVSKSKELDLVDPRNWI